MKYMVRYYMIRYYNTQTASFTNEFYHTKLEATTFIVDSKKLGHHTFKLYKLLEET